MGTTQQVILITTVTAGAALAQQRFVGANNTPCKAGAAALGVAEVDAVTGDSTPVSVLGIIAVEAGAAVSRVWLFSQMLRPEPCRSPATVNPVV